MIWVCIANLGFKIWSTNVKAKKIDNLLLQIFKIVINTLQLLVSLTKFVFS